MGLTIAGSPHAYCQMQPIGRFLIGLGAMLLLTGLCWELAGKFLPWGRLPGDVVIGWGNVRFYFPIVTCLPISLLLSLAVWAWQARPR